MKNIIVSAPIESFNLLVIIGIILIIILIIFIIGIAGIVAKSDVKNRKQQTKFDEMYALLSEEIRELNRQNHQNNLIHKQHTEAYLTHTVAMLRLVDKYELVNTADYKTWEKDLINTYHIIQKELQRFALMLYAENKEGMQFNPTVQGYINKYNQTHNINLQVDIFKSNTVITYNTLFVIIKIINLVGTETDSPIYIDAEQVILLGVNAATLPRLKALAYAFNLELTQEGEQITIQLQNAIIAA